jgi:uncharacterized protein GlcG (DUF336 family)
MFRSHTAVAVIAAAVLAAAANCSSTRSNSPAETQQGAVADLNRSPQAGSASARCRDLPSADDLKKWLRAAPGVEGEAGGLFSGQMEWASIVNRQGELCATSVATDDPASAWPGSQAISKAKAYTANAYSTDGSPLSTARLYTLTQPGHSLWGVAEPNPFRADCLAAPRDMNTTNGKICGGSIAFGGGVPLYKGKTRVGGLGVSGDTACADHEIAKRIRHLAQLDPEKGEFADDVIYAKADGPSPFAHPLCANTWRNGQKLGDEANAADY